MPGKNMETLAKWENPMNPPAPEPDTPGDNGQTSQNGSSDDVERRGRLDQVPKTGNGKTSPVQNTAPQADRIELYIKIRKKENEQDTEN